MGLGAELMVGLGWVVQRGFAKMSPKCSKVAENG